VPLDSGLLRKIAWANEETDNHSIADDCSEPPFGNIAAAHDKSGEFIINGSTIRPINGCKKAGGGRRSMSIRLPPTLNSWFKKEKASPVDAGPKRRARGTVYLGSDLNTRPRNSLTTESDRMREQIIMALEKEREEQAEKERSNRGPMWRYVPLAIIDNKYFIAITLSLTFWALMGDDCRLKFTNQPADFFFDMMTVICIVVFSFEIVLSCMAKPDYVGGFFFNLDVISTITLVLDITTVNDAIFQADDSDLSQVSSTKSARVGARAARVVRILRLVRILKLYKTVYEARQRAAKRAIKDKKKDLDAWEDDVGDDFTALQESMAIQSNVGKKLTDLTTRRCVVLILAMMLVYPMLEAPGDIIAGSATYGADMVLQTFKAANIATDTMGNGGNKWHYADTILSYIYFHNWHSRSLLCDGFCSSDYDRHLIWFGLASTNPGNAKQLARLAQIGETAVAKFDSDIEAMGTTVYEYGPIPASTRGFIGGDWNRDCWSTGMTRYLRMGVSLLSEDKDFPIDCPDQLRKVETSMQIAKLITKSEHIDNYHFTFFFDMRMIVRREAEMNLYTTVFIVVVLIVASVMFGQDAELYVVRPVEDMMFKVNLIRINPLIAATLTDEAFKRETKTKLKQERAAQAKGKFDLKTLKRWVFCKGKEEEGEVAETIILEKTIIKLGTLLALGFGVAGTAIVSTNLGGQESSGINAMIDGNIVKCFIGYARIGNFSTFTEALQGRVMTFVNQVAEIIHGVIDSHRGAPSVNNGDAFMLVWRERPGLPGTESSQDDKLSDLAACSLALIIAGLAKSRTLATYSSNPKVQQRLGTYSRVVVTLGFHYGWAIEGALGSEYKIDASYISPATSVAQTVEEATHTYGTNILLTEAAHKMFSTTMRSQCRLIDRVKVKGQTEPINLYSIDLDNTKLKMDVPQQGKIQPGLKWNMRHRFRARQFLEIEKTERAGDAKYASTIFDEHADVVAMRSTYTTEFQQIFVMAFHNYSEGEWKTAESLLRRSLEIVGLDDGPSLALLRYMNAFSFQAPKDWKGFHLLEDIPPSSSSRASRFSAKASPFSSKTLPAFSSEVDLNIEGSDVTVD